MVPDHLILSRLKMFYVFKHGVNIFQDYAELFRGGYHKFAPAMIHIFRVLPGQLEFVTRINQGISRTYRLWERSSSRL